MNSNFYYEMSEEQAATKIQSQFRGFKARKEIKTMSDVKETAEELDIDLEDPDLSVAATKIQASFRGHKARKGIKDQEEETEEAKLAALKEAEAKKIMEELDIDPDDPEVEKAATLIQAGFRGYKARKEKDEPKEGEVQE